jgi:hypothetical protein
MRRIPLGQEIQLVKANQLVLARMPGGQLVVGKWFYQRTTDQHKPHRVRLRRLVSSVTLELSDQEFSQFVLIAIANH